MNRKSNHRNCISLKDQIRTQINGSNWTPTSAILELIDNAVDAGAKNISITYNPGTFTMLIEDDGIGCDCPYVIIEPNNREDTHGGKGTGQYGIGGSYAAIYLTNMGRVSVESVRDNKRHFAQADWSTLDDDQVQFPTTGRVENAANTPSGTKISLRKVNGTRAGATVTNALSKRLGVLYKPGITDGLNITIYGETVPRPVTPLLVRPLETHVLKTSGGMTFRATMGLLNPNVNEPSNNVYYGPRKMDCGPDFLADVRTNSSRIVFDVYFDPDQCRRHSLIVATTKERFQTENEETSNILDEVRRLIVDKFSSILNEAAEQVQTFRLNFMSTAINKAVRSALSSNVEAVVNPDEESETVETGNGRGRSAPNIVRDRHRDQSEIGNEKSTGGEFGINFRLEPTTGNAAAIALELTGSEIVLRVNQDKKMGRTPEQEVEWMLGAIPGLIRARLYDWGSNREFYVQRLVKQNPDWAYLLEPEKRGGFGTTPLLIELFNNASYEARAALTAGNNIQAKQISS